LGFGKKKSHKILDSFSKIVANKMLNLPWSIYIYIYIYIYTHIYILYILFLL
jgi:hypothetical protein